VLAQLPEALPNVLDVCSEAAAKVIVEECMFEISYRYTPPLMHAAATGNTFLTELLIKLGADVNAKTSDGQSALFITVEHGSKGAAGGVSAGRRAGTRW
jgi:hypothetical protein